MQWSDLPVNPSPSTLRQFAGLWILFFGGLAGWHWMGLDQPRSAAVLGVLAATVGPVGLVFPGALRPIFVGWLVVAFPIGWVVSRAVLIVLFFGVITPLAAVFRLNRRDVLHLRRQPDRTTYWTPKTSAGSARSYFRQF